MARFCLGIVLAFALFAGLLFASAGPVPAPTAASITALAPATYRVASQQGDVACGASAAQDIMYQNARLIEIDVETRQLGDNGSNNDILPESLKVNKILIDPVGWTRTDNTAYQNMNTNSTQRTPIVFWKAPGRTCYNYVAAATPNTLLNPITFTALGYGNDDGFVSYGQYPMAGYSEIQNRIIIRETWQAGHYANTYIPVYITPTTIQFKQNANTPGIIYYKMTIEAEDPTEPQPHVVPPTFTTNRGMTVKNISATQVLLSIPSTAAQQTITQRPTMTVLPQDFYRIATSPGDVTCPPTTDPWFYTARLIKVDLGSSAYFGGDIYPSIYGSPYRVNSVYIDPIGTLNGTQNLNAVLNQSSPKVLWRAPGRACLNWNYFPVQLDAIGFYHTPIGTLVPGFMTVNLYGSDPYGNPPIRPYVEFFELGGANTNQYGWTRIPVYINQNSSYPITFMEQNVNWGALGYRVGGNGTNPWTTHLVPPSFTTNRGMAFTAIDPLQVAFTLPTNNSTSPGSTPGPWKITALAPYTYRVATSPGSNAPCGASATQDWSYSARLINMNTYPQTIRINFDTNVTQIYLDPIGIAYNSSTLNGVQNPNAPTSQWQQKYLFKVPGRDCYNWVSRYESSLFIPDIGNSQNMGQMGVEPSSIYITEFTDNGIGAMRIPLFVTATSMQFKHSSYMPGSLEYSYPNWSNWQTHVIPPTFTSNRGFQVSSIYADQVSFALPSNATPGSTPGPGKITALPQNTYRLATTQGDVPCGASAAQDWSYQNAKLINVNVAPKTIVVDGFNLTEVYIDPIGMTNGGSTSLNGIQAFNYLDPSYARVLYHLPGRACYNWEYIGIGGCGLPNMLAFDAIGAPNVNWTHGCLGLSYGHTIGDYAPLALRFGEVYNNGSTQSSFIPVFIQSGVILFKPSVSASGRVFYNYNPQTNQYNSYAVPPTFVTNRGIAWTAVNMDQVAFSLPAGNGTANTTTVANLTTKTKVNATVANKTTIAAKSCVIADIKCDDKTMVREYADSKGCKHTCAAEAKPTVQTCATKETTYVDCSWYASKPTAPWVGGDSCTYACEGSETDIVKPESETSADIGSKATDSTATDTKPSSTTTWGTGSTGKTTNTTTPTPVTTNTSASKSVSSSKTAGALYDEEVFSYSKLMNILGVYIEGFKQ